MRLSRLEIYGFKSFAKRTEIVFPLNVTGIVGPNGSGKSNIADAVRWVLGEQSARNLRGNSMADVIFNGTETKRPMNYCEVTLVFDNTDRKLTVPFAEVSITRRVYRSGDSEYQMNGAACRLKDIVDLFRDTGVGREGYSIIGQGRIDEILSQRSEDRRSVFEEAAGISRYRTRKEDAENRLRRADENLVRVTDVLEELETHLAPLEKQAEVAREYLALSETLRELDVGLFLTRYDRQKSREESVTQALEAIAQALEAAGARLEEVGSQRDASEARQEEIQEALTRAHALLLQGTDSLHEAKAEAARAEDRLSRGGETLQRLALEAESLQNRKALIEATMTQQDGGLSEAAVQRDAAETALKACKAAFDTAAAGAEALEARLADHKSAIIDSLNRMRNVHAALARQTAMQSQMTSRREEIDGELLQSGEAEAALTAALTAAGETLAAEQARFDELKAAADALDEATKSLLADILSRQRLAQEAAQSARALDTRLKTLRELQEGFEGYQHSVKNALQYARHKGLSGVRGVVAMLLRVPGELETAIDMALGGAMQNIVTQTEQDAKEMIEHLRRNHLGRATFLPLSTVRGRVLSQQERRVLSMPGCVGLASELCGFDEAYRPVMESLLGRTVVAEDLDSGIAIMRAGKHAFRLVTLKGDVMHSGGSMTGGSIQQKAQNLLGRDREIRELTHALTEKSGEAARETAAVAALEAERAERKERREAAQYALHQQEIAVTRDTERLRTAREALQEHRAKAESLARAREQLEESLRDIGAELTRLERQTSDSQLSTEDMNAATEALAAELEKARRARETAQEALTAAMLRLQEAEHACDRIRRDQRRLLGDGEACEKELRALQAKREAALGDMEAARAERERAAGSIALREAEAQSAREAVTELEERLAAARQEARDLQRELEAGQKLLTRETDRLHRQEMALERVRGELSALTARLWDTYELTYAGAVEARAQYGRMREEDAREEALGETEADARAQEIRDRIRGMGTVNVGAIEEYAQLHERFAQLSDQREDLVRAKADLTGLIERLLAQMEAVFVGQFSLLQGYFAETFTRLFGGGHGEIQLADPADPLNCGIEIIVQPPGKKRQLLSLFSGGERALTAIAILFAMLMLKPTPFCILDEIEAALDEANIGYFADYLKEFSQDTQFVVVTHRKGTMERCDTLFGVAMEERGVSSMVSVNLTDYE